MLIIDGSAGEGGGQVLRTALGLSLATQRPFRITKIRGRRPKPGLLRQHLTCVRAAAELGEADVDGAELGSGELYFRPKTLRSGSFEFSIGSAGSATLVLQAVLPGLLRSKGPTMLAIEGGTHNGLSPAFDFLARSFVPAVAKMGLQVEARLVRYGFEPAGGGRIEVNVTPGPLTPFELIERGALLSRDAVALVSSVPLSVAQRELSIVREELNFEEGELHVREVESVGPGNALSIALVYEHVTDVFVGLGARGLSAERVARRTAGEVRRALRTDAPVSGHLADQLLIPMAMAGGGVFRTVEPTEHTRTQLDLIPRFLEISLTCKADAAASTWRISAT